MKRLRVKTGIVVPSRPSFVARFDKPQRQVMFPSAGLPALPVTESPLVPLIRCTTKPACGHCYYCQKAAGR